MTDLAAIKERQQQMWAAGDFSMIGVSQVIVSELLCEAVDLRAGQQVLDVATGSGNTALAAARRGCDVIGVDYVPSLLERGRERAAAERLRDPRPRFRRCCRRWDTGSVRMSSS